MKVLAVETSGAEFGIAAVRCEENNNAQVLSAITSAQPRQLSQQIIACIASALEKARWALDDVDAITVGVGPGSWTGLRIGLTTCKTLAQARNWKLAGVLTFDAIAQTAQQAAQRQVQENGAQPFLLLV